MNIRTLAAVVLVACAFFTRAEAGASGAGFKVPDGAAAAVVVFEDLQCPDCARAHPKLLEATRQAGVPLVIHDFPITRHVWAFPAAVLARWFTAQSPELGVEFRSHVFAHQADVNPETLRPLAEAFATEHGLTLPSVVDPDGTFKDAVQADFDLGIRIGLEYVPLVFVVSRAAGDGHWVEVTDLATLGATVERMKASK